MLYAILFTLLFYPFLLVSQVMVGAEFVFSPAYQPLLLGKRIGLITNQTAVNSQMQETAELFKRNQVSHGYKLQALFSPEHGIKGQFQASEKIDHLVDGGAIPIYSLYGETRRPTPEMLKNIDLLVYEIQDIGSRSYTYISTLFYVMEEAAKHHISLIVLDRPNPINGMVVDGPLLEEECRSFVGYINVPYCHGMTVGELALYFNTEYKINCCLTVIPMQGWKRHMTFQDTGLRWIPSSPNIPEAHSAFYYPITGILGELQLVNIGIGSNLPFRVVGAPWIDGEILSQRLNAQNLPGVHFHPYCYRPLFGRFSQENCQGILIFVTNPHIFEPVTTQYFIIGVLKTLYPSFFREISNLPKERTEMFTKVNGTPEVLRILKEEKYCAWKLKTLQQKGKSSFLQKRRKFLIASY